MSSNIPKVTIGFSNGNLNTQKAVIDGNAAFIGNAAVAGNADKVFTIASLDDAVAQGITATAEPEAYRQLSEFYNELGGTQTCYLLLLDAQKTMAQMLTSADDSGANPLIKAGAGKIAYLGVFKTVPQGYAGAGTDFMDADVAAAVAAAKIFVTYWNVKGYYFRIIIAGVISDENKSTVFQPNTANANATGVVLFSTQPDKLASVGLFLGRKVAYECHIKPGKVANGALTATQLYIGTKLVETLTNLDTLAGYGYIVALTYPNKAGYYFGVDYMACDDDYNLLAYCAVIDAAARVALDYYTNQLESEIDVDANGKLLDADAKHLEDNIYQQEMVAMGDRISDVKVIIDRGQTIVPGNKFSVKLRVIPKGYFTFIDVDLGLTA